MNEESSTTERINRTNHQEGPLTSSIQEPSLKLWSLQNNTLCVLANMPEAQLTCIDFWIKAGSLFENPGEEGIAHFLEHMVFKGGGGLNEGDFDRRIEALGGSSNAATGFDDVHYHVLVPSEALAEALELLLNLVLCPNIDTKAFLIEREVVLEEIAQHHDQPDEQIFQKLLEMCWGVHAYGRPILGNIKSLKTCSPEMMKSFHQRRYKGMNFTISIAGQIPEEFEKFINESLISTIQSNTTQQSSNTKTSNLIFTKQRKEIYINRLESARLTMAWPIPPAKKQVLNMGADLATSLLAEGRRSRLIHHLREDLQIVESIEMDITSLEEGGLIFLEACCEESQLEKVEKEIQIILKEVIHKPISEQELSRSCQLVKNSLCFSLELTSNVAAIGGAQALWGRHQTLLAPLDHIDYWSAANLQKEIFTNIQPEKCSTLIARPA